jgi:phosphotransferase system  glucose/maltose/N-acetylglucosamine-specific IIC component
MTYVFPDNQYRLRIVLQVVVMVLQVIIIIMTGFDLSDMTYHSWMSCIIAIAFAFIFWVTFAYVIDQFKNESREEVKRQFMKENSF